MLYFKNEYGICDIFSNQNIHKYTYLAQAFNSSKRIDIIYCSQLFKPDVWKINNDILNYQAANAARLQLAPWLQKHCINEMMVF